MIFRNTIFRLTLKIIHWQISSNNHSVWSIFRCRCPSSLSYRLLAAITIQIVHIQKYSHTHIQSRTHGGHMYTERNLQHQIDEFQVKSVRLKGVYIGSNCNENLDHTWRQTACVKRGRYDFTTLYLTSNEVKQICDYFGLSLRVSACESWQWTRHNDYFL